MIAPPKPNKTSTHSHKSLVMLSKLLLFSFLLCYDHNFVLPLISEQTLFFFLWLSFFFVFCLLIGLFFLIWHFFTLFFHLLFVKFNDGWPKHKLLSSSISLPLTTYPQSSTIANGNIFSSHLLFFFLPWIILLLFCLLSKKNCVCPRFSLSSTSCQHIQKGLFFMLLPKFSMFS
jgi:hypothetical protein